MQRTLIYITIILLFNISCDSSKNQYIDISDKINFEIENFDSTDIFLRIDTIIFSDVFGKRKDQNPKSLNFEIFLSIFNNNKIKRKLIFREEGDYLETYFYVKYNINLKNDSCYMYNYRLPVNEEIQAKEILRLNLYSLVFNEFIFGNKDDYLDDIIDYLPYFKFIFYEVNTNTEKPIYFSKDTKILVAPCSRKNE